jgi:hypothetical protein
VEGNKGSSRLLPTAAYELNIQFVLGLQQCDDGGEAGSAVHAGMLDILVSPFKRIWQKVEQEIRIEVGNKIACEPEYPIGHQKDQKKQQGILID